MRCLCQVSSYESSYVSIGDCFAALLKLSCHSAWGGGGRGATALPFRPRQARPLPLRVTVVGRCPTYGRFTVLSAVPFSSQFCGWKLVSGHCGFWLARWESNELHAALPFLFLKGENSGGVRFPCRIFGTDLALDAPDFLQTLVISFFLLHSRPPS